MRAAATSAAVALSLALAGAAGAQSYVPFTDPLPSTTTSTAEYQSGYNDMCREGEADTYQCVTDTIVEMDSRYAALHETCDHRGLFALSYLRTTEEYQRASLEPGFFQDPEFVNHEDAIFAQLYFDAYDRWEAGERSPARVPRAWQVAFQAAEDRSVTTLGDVMLGISAHINRDLPYTLATIALNDSETGASRKPDHDRVNEFLARVPEPLFAEIGEKWDPSYQGRDSALPVSTLAGLPPIQLWREMAWRWAERLVEARTASERRNVEQGIEEYAHQAALTIERATRLGPGEDTSARDAYCLANR